MALLLGAFLWIRWPIMYSATSRVSLRCPTQRDPFWVQTEMDYIRSRPFLEGVIKNLELDRRWALEKSFRTEQENFFRLREMITLEQFRGTMLLPISVKSDNPNEALIIANGIVDHYAFVSSNLSAEPIFIDRAEMPNAPAPFQLSDFNRIISYKVTID
jgi:hypothetical protein